MTELVDLVNRNGDVMMTAVDRSSIADYPDLHMKIVIVVITNAAHEILVHSRVKKMSDGSDIDHVCGAIQTRESDIDAGQRESLEEVGLEPEKLMRVTQGINEYGFYRYLLHGVSEAAPKPNPIEAEWAAYLPYNQLRTTEASGEMRFVKGFFEDIEAVFAARGLLATRNL